MAAVREQTESGNGGGYLVEYDIVMGSNVGVGNTLVLFVSEQNNSFTLSVSDNNADSWILINDGINDYTKGSFYYLHTATGGATTITLDWGAGNYQDFCFFVREYSGLATGANLDVSAEALDADFVNSHPTGTTANPAQANNLVVAAFTGDDNFLSYAASGFSNLVDANHSDVYGSGVMADKDITGIAAQSGTFTSGATYMKGYGCIAVFKEPGAPPATGARANTMPMMGC